MNQYKQSEQNSHNNLKKGRLKQVPRPKHNHARLPYLIEALLSGATTTDAAAKSGVSREATSRFITSLRKLTPPAIYISDYVIKRGGPVPVYAIGYDKDAIKPKSLSAKEKSARFRNKQNHLMLLHATAGPSSTQNSQGG